MEKRKIISVEYNIWLHIYALILSMYLILINDIELYLLLISILNEYSFLEFAIGNVSFFVPYLHHR